MTNAKPFPKVDCAACNRPLKCCDFQPFIPAHLIGGWITDSARTTLPILAHAIWQPIGLIPRSEYRQKHAQVSLRGEEFRCGFYRQGLCSIWKFRPSECRTYFCDDESDSPERSQISERTFHEEAAVAQMALVELGFTRGEIAAQVDVLNSGVAQLTYGEELVFMYKKAWTWSQTLTPQLIQSWLEI